MDPFKVPIFPLLPLHNCCANLSQPLINKLLLVRSLDLWTCTQI